MASIDISTIAQRFGATERPTLLLGGQGKTWRAGDIILKPLLHESEATELAGLIDALPAQPNIRLPRPIRSDRGSWIEAGYVAWTYLEGRSVPARYAEKIAACGHVSDAFRNLPKPHFIEERDDPWSIADRVTWGERAATYDPPFQGLIDEVRSQLQPINLPCQVIHGDIAGNLVFADGLPPGAVDLTLYWRPADFAKGLLVVDAVAWEGASPAIYSLIEALPQMRQLALRAGLRRIVEQPEQMHRGWKDLSAAEPIARRYIETMTALGVR